MFTAEELTHTVLSRKLQSVPGVASPAVAKRLFYLRFSQSSSPSLPWLKERALQGESPSRELCSWMFQLQRLEGPVQKGDLLDQGKVGLGLRALGGQWGCFKQASDLKDSYF